MNKIPVIIDCDPGHDDAIALAVAFASEKLDIRAVTTVGGNQTLDKTTANALKVLSFLGVKDVPVAMGAAEPLGGPLKVAANVHGDSGMDGPQLPDAEITCSELSAIELMEKVITESKEPVTLIPMGPLTNIAGFLVSCPHLAKKISRISLMGGGAMFGAWTPSAEFNVWQDPEAAFIVFSSGIPITMHGIDNTRRAFVTDEDIEKFRTCGRVGAFAAELMDFFTQYTRAKGLPFGIHDANAVAWVIDPSIYETVEGHVEVDLYGSKTRGCTVVDIRSNWAKSLRIGKPVTDIAMGVDRERFVDLLINSFKKYN